MTIEQILKGNSSMEELKNRFSMKSIMNNNSAIIQDIYIKYAAKIESCIERVFESTLADYCCGGLDELPNELSDEQKVVYCKFIGESAKKQIEDFKNFLDELFGSSAPVSTEKPIEKKIEIEIFKPAETVVAAVPQPSYFGY